VCDFCSSGKKEDWFDLFFSFLHSKKSRVGFVIVFICWFVVVVVEPLCFGLEGMEWTRPGKQRRWHSTQRDRRCGVWFGLLRQAMIKEVQLKNVKTLNPRL